MREKRRGRRGEEGGKKDGKKKKKQDEYIFFKRFFNSQSMSLKESIGVEEMGHSQRRTQEKRKKHADTRWRQRNLVETHVVTEIQ